MSWRYPPNDLWCEFVQSVDDILVHSDGQWIPWFYGAGCSLGVNTQDYKVGALSIEMACYASPYMENMFELRLGFADGRELDLTNGKLHEFWMKATKIVGEGAIKPAITMRLLDAEVGDFNKKVATKTFQLSSNDWQHESVKVGPEAIAEWIIDAGFDWTHIKEIHFVFNQEKRGLSAVTEFFRVDGLLFHFLIDVSLISVDSNPFSGVPVRIDSIEDLTPATWEIDPPGVMQVTIASEHAGWVFDHWHDGVETPGRTVDASAPGVYALTAFYREEPVPPPPPPPIPLPDKWYPGYYMRYLLDWIRKTRSLI